MLPDRVSNPGPLTYESGALPIALRGPALLKKQSDQGLPCLPFHPHLLDTLMQCYVKLFYFLGQLWQLFEVSQILEFLR